MHKTIHQGLQLSLQKLKQYIMLHWVVLHYVLLCLLYSTSLLLLSRAVHCNKLICSPSEYSFQASNKVLLNFRRIPQFYPDTYYTGSKKMVEHKNISWVHINSLLKCKLRTKMLVRWYINCIIYKMDVSWIHDKWVSNCKEKNSQV